MLNENYFTNKEEQYEKFKTNTKIDKTKIEVKN